MTTKKSAEKDQQPLAIQDPRLLPAYYQEDEISLVDLWLVLAKRKRLIAAVAGTIAVAGLLYALLMPRAYTYTTSIEIARDGDKLLESPQTVLAKLQESYIPLVLTEHAGTGFEQRETRAITTAMRSLEPTGTSRKLVLSVVILLGLILAVFAAFFAEFLDKVRERKAEVINGQAG